jgi:hypothetical protein
MPYWLNLEPIPSMLPSWDERGCRILTLSRGRHGTRLPFRSEKRDAVPDSLTISAFNRALPLYNRCPGQC